MAVVSADHLHANTELGEIVDRSLRVRFGWVGEDQKAAKRHVPLLISSIVRLGRNLARSQSQDPKPLGPLRLKNPNEFGTQCRRKGDIGGVAPERRADIEHIGKCALGNDEMLCLIAVFRHNDGQPAAKKIVRNFVDLSKAVRRQACAAARGHNRVIERIFDASLERCVEEGKLANFGGRPIVRIQRTIENDGTFGQCTGLVGAQNIHAAKVFDGFQAADEDAPPAHISGARGQGHTDDRWQQLWR